MPWREVCYMEERMRFAAAALADEESMSELCDQFGISRKTGYKWLARYAQCAVAGLLDRRRARRTQAHALGASEREMIVALRGRHKCWGPRKLKAVLEREHPGRRFGAPSTIGALLRRAGLSAVRRPRRRRAQGTALSVAMAPNDVWCADFKGWFRTGDGRRCEPLTISDAYSRYLLECRIVGRTDAASVEPLFERAFRRFGQPLAIRTDNGAPFACGGTCGLTRLAVKWAERGIRLERIEPGHPEQNGRHERLHRTLKAETLAPPAADATTQQRRFDHFRREYNNLRPHQALGQRPPGELYRRRTHPVKRARRAWPYPTDWQLRRVRSNGEIRWRSRLLFVSEALVAKQVALEQLGDERWRLWFADLALGVIDRGANRLRRERVGPRPDPLAQLPTADLLPM